MWARLRKRRTSGRTTSESASHPKVERARGRRFYQNPETAAWEKKGLSRTKVLIPIVQGSWPLTAALVPASISGYRHLNTSVTIIRAREEKAQSSTHSSSPTPLTGSGASLLSCHWPKHIIWPCSATGGWGRGSPYALQRKGNWKSWWKTQADSHPSSFILCCISLQERQTLNKPTWGLTLQLRCPIR